MPMVQIPIGMELTLVAGEVYSVPCTPVRFDDSLGLDYMIILGAAWAPLPDNTPVKGGFVRPTVTVSIRLKRIKIGQPGNDK
jgi:hypothetical protein